jgi:hypothetical protein
MTTVVTRGAASAQALGYASSSATVNYIEDVFSTYLYTGNGSTQTITNGIDLSGKGGLVWAKNRVSAAGSHRLYDSTRAIGVSSSFLATNNTNAETSTNSSTGMTAFNSNGFSIGSGTINTSSETYASWTFREQPKFFDIVTYTGNGVAGRTISHNLGSTPGCIIVKRTDSSPYDWVVYHRSLSNENYLYLNSINPAAGGTFWNDTTPTSSVFSVSAGSSVNASGGTYVAYLFAHDAGGFGLTGTDNVISCGSFTTNGLGSATVSLGYEPQWVVAKASGTESNWFMLDNMRGMTVQNSGVNLFANTSGSETGGSTVLVKPRATGFDFDNGELSSDYIYIAIRRGPMKVPTDATTVFVPVAYTGTNVDNRLVNTGISTDMALARIRTTTSTGGFYTASRLTGDASLGTAITAAQDTDPDSFMTPTVGYGNSFSAMNGFGVGNDATRQLNQSSTSQLAYAFRRAPGYFDVVCYRGDGTLNPISHNLAVSPELVIVKRTSSVNGWYVSQYLSAPSYGKFETTAAFVSLGSSYPVTATTFVPAANASAQTFVAYLFATCPGVSKVGSYTGNGTTQTINCGFGAGGVRFVLIKRTDAVGDWYVYDTARGMTVLTDPYLLFNTTAAEVATLGSVTTVSTGFALDSSILAAINVNAGSYIFLAIA